MQYVGLWHGGDSYSMGEWATDAEVFESLNHAREVVLARHRNLSWMARSTHAAEWNPGGSARQGNLLDSLATPAVEGSALWLVPASVANLSALESDGAYACSHQLTIGPRGGVVTHKL